MNEQIIKIYHIYQKPAFSFTKSVFMGLCFYTMFALANENAKLTKEIKELKQQKGA